MCIRDRAYLVLEVFEEGIEVSLFEVRKVLAELLEEFVQRWVFATLALSLIHISEPTRRS